MFSSICYPPRVRTTPNDAHTHMMHTHMENESESSLNHCLTRPPHQHPPGSCRPRCFLHRNFNLRPPTIC